LKYYRIGAKDDEAKGMMSIQGALAKGMAVDIMHVGLGNVQPYLVDTKLGIDISPLIKKHNYDLNILYPQAVTAAKTAGNGVLYGLPVNTSALKIYYNRDLFDKFGVSYPKDGLTWDEAYDLTKRMTREVDGKLYLGGIISFRDVMTSDQLKINYVDPKTNAVLFDKDPNWQRLVSNVIRFHQIPGNNNTNTDAFIKDGTAAMFITKADLNSTWTVNWDIARAPVYTDLPKNGQSIVGSMFTVVSTSKHKDEAFQVVAAIASKEHMLEMARVGSLSVLNDPEVRKVFGQDIPWLKGRKINLAAMFPAGYTEPHDTTPYDGIAQKHMNQELNSLISGKTPDINTALRQATEAANKEIVASLTK
jgi:multiple sugar transport system substrate-binding protein